MKWRFWQVQEAKPKKTRTAKPKTEKPFKGYSRAETGKRVADINLGELSHAELWQNYDKLYNEREEVASAVLKIAGYVVSRGYVTIPSDPNVSQAKKAKLLCDQYAEEIGLDQMIYDGTIPLVVHGTMFLENNIVANRVVATRVFPWQSEIEPSQLRADGKILEWRQVRNGRELQTFKEQEIVAIQFPPVDRDGFGTSLISPIVQVLATQAQLDKDMKKYIHLTAWPKEDWQLGDANDKVDQATADEHYQYTKKWQAGDVYVHNYPAKYTACGVGPVESRMFPEMVKVINDRCVDGTMVPPISYIRNSTEASAHAMISDLRIALVQPIQRLWKRAIEHHVFQPLILGERLKPEYTPRISFTPPTEDELWTKAKRIISILQTRAVSPAWLRDELDIPEDNKYLPQPAPDQIPLTGDKRPSTQGKEDEQAEHRVTYPPSDEK